MSDKWMPRAAMPSSYPIPSTYDVSCMHVYLSSMTMGAKVYYTTDGSVPSEKSSCFAPDQGGILLHPFGMAARQLQHSVTIKAIAVADGLAPSKVATFEYHFANSIAEGTCNQEVLRDRTATAPGLVKLYDYSRVNMFLIIGSTRALLVDGGMDCKCDVYKTVMAITGGLPFDLVMLHGHRAHTAQCINMIRHNVKVYVPKADRHMLADYGEALTSEFLDLQDGDVFDLGTTQLEAISLPGHTEGSMILLDRATGDLYTSDAIGSPEPWMPGFGRIGLGGKVNTLENYLNALMRANSRIDARAERIWTGHSIFPIVKAQTYLDACIACVKEALERETATSIGGMEKMIGIDDYRLNPNYAAFHIRNFADAEYEGGHDAHPAECLQSESRAEEDTYLNKTCMPLGYPMPGNYDIAYLDVRLSSQTPDAKIFYTMDGSEPDETGTYYDAKLGPIPTLPFWGAADKSDSAFVIKAVAIAPGKAPSDVATLVYNFHNSIAPGHYATEVLRDRTDEVPGLIRIFDYSRVDMYLIVGSTAAVLLDGGSDATLDLYETVQELSGGLPLSYVMLHGHFDHIYQTPMMLKHSIPCYAPKADWYMFDELSEDVTDRLIDLTDDIVFDLGNAVLETHHLCGHTPGHRILLDRKNADLYTSDAIGVTDPWGPNSCQINCSSLEFFLRELKGANEWINGDAQRIWCGHNQFPICPAQEYIDDMISIAEDALERREDALIPSVRAKSVAPIRTTLGSRNDYRINTKDPIMNVKYWTDEDMAHDLPIHGWQGEM